VTVASGSCFTNIGLSLLNDSTDGIRTRVARRCPIHLVAAAAE